MTYENASRYIDLDEAEARAVRSNGHTNGHVKDGKPGPVIRTAEQLRQMVFPPVSYVVPGFISEGCTVLAGAPKLGKSWFVMDVGLAVARGGYCLGEVKCPQGDVLYLALEDNERRLQRRVSKVLGADFDAWPDGFTYATEWPRSNEGGAARIREWIAGAKNPRLVVVDVLAMFRAPRVDKQSVYEGDYLAIKELHKIASDTGVAIVIVHHVRKGGSDLDPFEEVSGSFGIMGAADAGLILRRTSNGVTLYARGRDIEEAETAVTFDRDTCRWRALGDAGDIHKSDERGQILAALLEATEPLGPREIAIAAGSNRNAVDRLLYKMTRDGEVQKAGRGLYVHPDRTDLHDQQDDDGKNGKKVRTEGAELSEAIEDQENEHVDATIKPGSDNPSTANLTDLHDLTGDVETASGKIDGAFPGDRPMSEDEHRAVFEASGGRLTGDAQDMRAWLFKRGGDDVNTVLMCDVGPKWMRGRRRREDALDRLVEMKLATIRQEPSPRGRPMRLVTLTEKGRTHA